MIEVPTMGRDSIRINTANEVIKPNTVKRIQGQGLPFPKESSRRGDLLVSFEIKFPESLTTTAKDILFDTLP